jgi:hypothetical protein
MIDHIAQAGRLFIVEARFAAPMAWCLGLDYQSINVRDGSGREGASGGARIGFQRGVRLGEVDESGRGGTAQQSRAQLPLFARIQRLEVLHLAA